MQNDVLKRLWKSKEVVDVYENPLVALWMREKAKRDSIAFCRLIGDNKHRLSHWLGRGVLSEDGKENLWCYEESHFVLLIGTSKNGTVFKVVYPGGIQTFSNDRRFGASINLVLEKICAVFGGSQLNI